LSEQIVGAWWETFRNTHVTPRQVVTAAIEGNETILAAISSYAEEDESLVSALRRWLRKHECVPFDGPDGNRVYFILRDDARWQLYPIVNKETVAA
jgi:hypothetical protein